jgi:hypothetical protein
MIESYRNAIEEYKRVDHLFYVTLKYTRKVDVIRSMIDRLIATFEYGIEAILRCMKDEKSIEDIPASPVAKGDLAIEKCESEEMCGYMNTYLLLRKIMRADYKKREEYRRHVTMITELAGKTLEIDIDLLKEYYDDTGCFLKYIKERVKIYQDE